MLPPNAPIATTKEAIKKLWGDLLASPGLVSSWKANKVEVAKSGDLGFVSDTYEFTMNDTSGKPTTDKGKYVEAWEKQANGKGNAERDLEFRFARGATRRNEVAVEAAVSAAEK